MSFLTIFIQEKDGRFSASVPALPGCFSQGDTLEESQKNIQEAISLYLEGEEVYEAPMQVVTSVDVRPHNRYV